MGKKTFDQKALTRLKTRSGAGAHRDRRRRRQKDRLRQEMAEAAEAAWHRLRREEPA